MLLEVKNLSASYRWGLIKKHQQLVLNNISFYLMEDEILGLIGDSGVGKSTLSACILGLMPYMGSIQFQGKHLKKDKQISRKIQMVMQSPEDSFNPKKTILYSLLEPFRIHKELAESKKQAELKIRQVVTDLSLDVSRLDEYPYSFSGGQLQRFSIARAILMQPKIIILDEATSMLDVHVQAEIIHLLLKLKEKYKMSYLFISHDKPLIEYVCSRILYMENGALRENLVVNRNSD